MIKPICKDTILLRQKAKEARLEDKQVIRDLLDTLLANSDRCVGMAANMIGVNKAIIAFYNEITDKYEVMLNPIIVKKSNVYQSVEGCLSLNGQRPTTRYQVITVRFQDENMIKKEKQYIGFTAQIIQHECDHLEGILI